MAGRNIIEFHENLEPQFIAKATKCRVYSHSHVITQKLRKAAKELKENENIIIRRADKSPCFVVMERDAYKQKLDDILSDNTKFTVQSRNPILQLKTDLNKLIKSANEQTKSKIVQPIVGKYTPGYIYGTVNFALSERKTSSFCL